MATAMKAVDKRSPCLMIYTTKNYHRPANYAAFDLLGRVMSGTVYKGHRVRVGADLCAFASTISPA